MTALNPDLPDWTTENSAGLVWKDHAELGAGESQAFGLVGVGSYLINIVGEGIGEPIIAQLVFQASPVDTVGLTFFTITAQEWPDGGIVTILESPSYGGLVRIFNTTPTNILDINVFSSNRQVNTPALIIDIGPGRTYVNAAGFVAATPVFLTTGDFLSRGYAANGDAVIRADSTGDGVLQFWYRDGAGTQQIITVATVTAATVTPVQVSLPFCVGQFYFVPVADDPAGVITVLAYPVHTG